MQLRDYQQKAIASFYEYFSHSDGSPLIVLPTGAGKSLVLAGLCYEILQRWPNQRILVLSHVRELVAQDHDKLKEYWSKAPAGIYSASLGLKHAHHPITFATIQSVFRKPHILGRRDLVFIDEAHLLSRKDSGMYNQLLAGLKKTNPVMKLAGLTASPFRLDSGYLHEGDDALFTDICCEVPVLDLINQGYLTRLVSRVSELQADLRNVSVTAGEFNGKQMEAAFDQDGFTSAVLTEVLRLAEGRHSILFFCTGIDHANHVRDALRARGVTAEAVSGKTPKEERERILGDFKQRRFRALCSVNIITTGFDAPCVDCIVMLRATMSPVLYLQVAGRGMRLYPGKENCLFLDHGQNITRLGAITHITPPRRRTGRKTEQAEKPKVKICELCRSAWPLGTVECLTCGNIMVKERDALAKLDTKAADAEIMMTDDEYLAQTTTWVEVDSVVYRRHQKKGSYDSMRVEYRCSLMVYKEWVCPLHEGYAGKKALQWMKKRAKADYDVLRTGFGHMMFMYIIERAADIFRSPVRIRVRKNDKHFEVIDYDFGPPRQGELAESA